MTNANPLRVHLERMLMAQDGVPLDAIQLGQWVEAARAALAAAPQPAPDRALVAQIVQDAMIRTGVRWNSGSSEAIADALLARGLRLPAPETMAWAVVADGEIVWVDVGSKHDVAEHVAEGEGGRAVRVAIRVVEGGDDAA